jgi:hypothetical protein
MGERKISASVNASSQPTGGFGIRTELQLCQPHREQPPVGGEVVRREPEGFKYMAFSLGRLPHKIFAVAEKAMSIGQIAVKR